MKQQTVHNRPIQGIKGFLAILGAAAALMALSALTQWAAQRTGMGGITLITWALAIVAVVYVLFGYIGEYRYTLSDGVLVFEREKIAIVMPRHDTYRTVHIPAAARLPHTLSALEQASRDNFGHKKRR